MLRREGKSLRQIKEIVGPMSNVTLHDALRGVPPPDWTRRPNAKDELRAKARELRVQGLDYEEIAAALGVAKGSVSHWVRDLPRPARLSYAECRKRSAEGSQRYWEAERPVREARRAAERAAAAAQIGDLTDRELLIAGAIAYGTPPADLSFRICIHENADAESAQRFWLEITGARPDQFLTPTLKRHNPKTVRKNVGEDYHGCLRIDVNRSSDLYRKIEGWAEAIMSAR
jgi:hypothetical protein